jgi:tetratricopeptide (TPR) repeat protein
MSEQIKCRWITGVLVVVTLVLYFQTATFDFTIFDDNQYVSGNAVVQHGLGYDSIIWAFTTGYTGNWIPVTWLSHMAVCDVFGVNAGAHHLVNVALHIFNAILLFFLLRQMTGAVWRSAIVAALFAWHPLRVESVAWVSERKDVLSTLFGLLSIWAYKEYAFKSRSFEKNLAGRFYFFALLSFAIGLMSKSVLVTWPFLLLLLDYWPLDRLELFPLNHRQLKAIVTEKIPFLLLALVVSVVTFATQTEGRGLEAITGLPLSNRLANAVISYWRYLDKTFLPINLAVFYPHPGSWPLLNICLALAAFLSLSGMALYTLRNRPWIFVGWFWYVGTLLPVIGLVQVGAQSMADRYTYIPHVGLFIAIVWSVAEWTNRQSRRWAMIGVTIVILLACICVSWAQINFWENSVTLFGRALAVTSENSMAENNYAVALGENGPLDERIKHYSEAVRIKPTHFSARVNLGQALYESGRFQEATNQLMQAVQIYTNHAVAYYDLGLALTALKEWGKAEQSFAVAAKMDMNDVVAYQMWAKTLLAQSKYADAIYPLSRVLKLSPESAEAHAQMAVALEQQGQFESAIKYYRETVRIQPDCLEALNNLSWLLATQLDARLRNGSEAVQLAQRACDLTSYEQPIFIGTLAAAYAEAEQFDDAQKTAKKAIEVAESLNQKELAEKNRKLLESYQEYKPYRQ